METNPFGKHKQSENPFGKHKSQPPGASALETPPSFTDAFTRGLKRTLPETKGLLAGAGAAVAGAVGAEGVRDTLLNTYQDIQRDEVAPLANPSGFIDSVTGDGSLKEWAGDTLGNFAGQALQSVAAAGAGALVGSAAPGVGTVAGGIGGLVAKAGAKDIVAGAVERMVGQGIAKDVAEKTVLRRLGGAAVAGTGLNVGQEVGTAFTGRAEDAAAAGEQLNQQDALRAIGYGVPAGLVDTAAEALTGSRLMQGVSDSPKMLRRMAKGAGIGAVSEGATEGVQAVLERAGAARGLTGEEAYRDYIENAAAGALGGGVAGAGGGFRRQQDPAAPPPPETPPPMTPEVNASQALPPASSPLATPPAGPLTRAAATVPGAAPLATPPADVTGATAQTPTDALPPLIADTAAQAVAAPPAADPVFEQAKQLLGEAGKVQRGKLAEKLGLNRNQMQTLLDQLHAAGIVGPSNGKKARKLLVNPITGEVLDPKEKAKLDKKQQLAEQQKAIEASVRGGPEAAAVAAAAQAQGNVEAPAPAQSSPAPLTRLATPPDPAAFQAKMEARRESALSRAPRPDPTAGATSAAAAVAFDTGAAAIAEQQKAQAEQDQQVQAQAAQQAEAEKAQAQQQKITDKQAKEADKAARQADKDRRQAEKDAQAEALKTTDADIQVAVQADIDAGKPMDSMRMSALAKKLGVTPRRVDQMRVALAQKRKATAATTTTTDSLTAVPVPETPALPISQSTPAAVEPPRAAPVAQPQASAGPLAAQPESKAEQNPTSYDTSPDQLDDDITPPSGSPWTIRSAADATAKRTPGGQVFEVDGGFVVRVPKAVVAQSATTAPDPGLEDALRRERDAYTNERDDAYLNKTKHARDPVKDAIEDALNAGVLDPDAARVVLDVALSNGRVDLAEYAVSRAERAVAGMSVTPGVPQNSPKYADIKAALESRKREATALLDSLKKDLAAAKTATVKESLTVAAAKPKAAIATDVAGEQLDDKWTAFAPETGTLNVPRAEMPQVKSEHRGAMVQYLAARGITHEQAEVPADSLKPTQAEFSAGKVKKALKRAADGEDRAILVSADGHVLDGHHQWLAKREAGAPVKVIRLNAPIAELLQQVKEFPSSTQANGATATVEGATPTKPNQTAQEPTNAEQTQRTEQAPAPRQAAEKAKPEALLSEPAKPSGAMQRQRMPRADAVAEVQRQLKVTKKRATEIVSGIKSEAKNLDGVTYNLKPGIVQTADVQAAIERERAKAAAPVNPEAPLTVGDQATAAIPAAKRRLREARNRGDAKAEVEIERELQQLRAQVWDETPAAKTQEAPVAATTQPEKGIVGRRADGVMIREDERGVRWYAQGGVRIFETVSMRPTRQGMQIDRGVLQREFMTAEESAAAAKDAAPTEQPKAKPAPSANTIVTDADAEAARARLKAKFNRLNSGIDPEMMLDGITLGMYHIERGARTFAAYAKAMVDDLGDAVKPYLKSWYMGVKYDPRAAGFDGMDSAASVESAVVDSTPEPEQDSVTEDSTDAAPDQPSPKALDSAPAEEGSGTAPAGETGVSPPGGGQTGVRSDSGAATVRVPPTRGGRGGTVGVSDSKTGATGGGRRGSRRTARAGAGVSEDDAGLTGEQTPETAQPPNIPAINFKIGDDTGLGKGGEVAKFKDNVEAIRTLKLIESERRRATPDEQRALARWVGWGGLASAFPNPETGKFKDGWEQRGNDLRDMLTPSEYRAARRSTRNAHFTSEVVVNFMWDAVRRLGYRNGLALESSMGSGNFVGLMPDDIAARFIGVEYDSITARLAGALYPQATVLHSGFQDVPLPDGTFDLNIGNPPFGSESLRFQFKPELRGLSIHNQFFLASLDALKAGGLQVQVVSSFLMDAQDKTARQKLADKADLVAAFRLPDTAFKENARTEVVTDILILRKRASPLPRDKDNKGKELPPDYPAWVNTDTVPDPLGGEAIPVNTYFKANPDHIIGTMDRSGKMRAAGMMNVHLDDPSTLGARLKALLAKVPQNVVNTAADVAERTEQAYTLLGEAMRISVAREEPGHMAFSADGKLTRVIEREHGEGTLLQRQDITADSPWSAQLFQDSDGRWYKVEVQTDEEGKAVKVADAAGAATRFNAYTRKVYATEAEIPSTLRLGKLGFERMTQLVNLRDLLKNQLVLETEDATKVKMEANRAKLAAAYKAYVEQHGPVNRRATATLVSEMPDGGLLLALESSYEPERTADQAKRSGLPKQSELAKPAAILSERVVPKYEPVTKAETPADALAITLAERGVVDIEHIAKLLGQSPEDAAAALTEGDKPLVFKDPELDTYETADAYLSGQVTRKLMAAQAAGLTQNAKALQAVQPERWGAENVSVQVGAAWVPPAVYADFATHLMGGSATASFSPITNTFTVAVKGTDKAKADQWGTDHMTGIDILSRLLNSQTPSVTYRDSEGKTHVDKEATTLAILKGREIVSEFGDWIFKDGARREQLVDIFNQKFNTRVSRQYDGQHLKLPGKVPDAMIQMRRHQKNAIWRGISSKFLLIDHVVGAGKTFTAIARAMERRRMGLAQKPTIVVPNHLVEQWQADVYRLYPGAKVLAATKKDFEKKNRRRLLSRVATGDYDIVILPHSSFGFVGISPETELRYLDEDLQLAIQAVKDAQAQAEEDGDVGYRKPLGVKEAERLVTKIQERMDKLREGARDRLLTFEQLGIDDLTIDEAHEFKNLFYSSRLTKVRGMGDKVGSRKAADLYNKVRVVRDSAGSVVFMTGTPVSNSVVELYTMMRYLAAPELKELGMEHFDAWRSQFVDATPAFEPNESGRLQEVTRLGRSWSNMRSLMDLYYSFTDAVTIDDIKQWYAEDNPGKTFPVPSVKGGDRQLRKVMPTPAQESVLAEVIAGFDGLDSIRDQQERNAARLRLMDRARKLSLDVRAVDPRAQSKEEGGKLELLSAEVKRIYDRWTPDRGTQLVFLDRSVPKAKGDDKIIKEYDAIVARRDKALKDDDEVAFQEANEALERYDADEIRELRSAQAGGWNAYQQIKDNLVALGIPAAEIRFVQEANTDEQKQALFDAVNGGKVRVLIGSTPRMGAGTNVQKRLVALHHADVTWKPSDIEQREGRIIRQGNDLLAKHGENFEVEILAYATERTVDAKMWSLNATKLRAINGLRKYTGDFTMEVEDSESVSMAEMAALASGNPLLLERVTLESEIANLELQEKAHRRKRFGIEDALERAQRIVDGHPARIERARTQTAVMGNKVESLRAKAAKRSVVVEGKTYTDAKSAMKAALDAVERQQDGNEKARYGITINGERVTSKDAIDTAIGQAIGDHETFEVQINGATYTQRTAGGRAAAEILSPRAADALEQPVSGKLGSMMGMDLLYQIKEFKAGRFWTGGRRVNIEVWLEDAGQTVASIDIDGHDPLIELNTATMRDALGKLASRVESAADPSNVTWLESELARAKREVPELAPKLKEPFAKAQEITDKRARLNEVVGLLTANPPASPAQPAADIESTPALARTVVSGRPYFRNLGGEIEYEPNAKKIELSEMPDGEFYIAPGLGRDSGQFEIMEATTGLRVGLGKTRKAAIEAANKAIVENRSTIKTALEQRAFPKDKLDAAIAKLDGGNRASFAKSGKPSADVYADGARGMPTDKLTRLLATAKQAMALLGVNIEVVANGTDLPAEITAQDDYDDTVQAAITGDRKTVYFVASRIKSPRDAMKLVAHELVGHMSMEQLLGKRWPELRDAILRLRDNGKWPEVFAEVSRRYERNADGTFRPLNDATFAGEAIAVFAERGIQTSILQRAMNAVRAWLRKLFPALELSQGELRQLLWEAGQKLEGRAYRSSAEKILGRPEPKTMREAVERYSFGKDGGSVGGVKRTIPDNFERMPEFQDGPDSTVLFHGSRVDGYLDEVKDRSGEAFSQWPGLFASRTVRAARSHGKEITAFRINDADLLTQSDLDALEESEVDAALASIVRAKPGSDEFDTIRRAVVDERGQESQEFMDAVGMDDAGEAGWHAQSLRGQLAAKLGYKAVEMDDEHGTSWYIVPGVKSIPVPDEQQDTRQAPPREGLGASGGRAAFAKAAPIESKAFKDWFDGSKVVDKKGQPLEVYHGTPDGGFDEFKDGDIYLSSSKTLAEQYTFHRSPWLSPGRNPEVRAVYVAAKNPLVIDAMGSRHDNIPVPWQQWKQKVFGRLPDNAVSIRAAVAHAKAKGHDALIVKNVVDTAIHDDRTKSTVYVAFSPAQVMSAREGAPTARVAFAKGSEPTIVDRLQDLVNPKDTTLLERIKNKLSDWRPAALGTLQLRHLGELAERILPPVALYSGVVQRMATMRNELQELGHGVVDAGMAYQAKNPKEAKVLFRMLHDATLEGVDPAQDYQPLMMMAADYRSNIPVSEVTVKAFRKTMKDQAKLNPGSAVVYINRAKEASKLLKQERARVKSYITMRPRFDALSVDAKQLWAQMRDAYKAQSDEYEKALISRIQSLAFDKAQKAGQIAKMRLMFEAARVPFYVPLSRWGNYWVSGTNSDGEREFFMQESAADQAKTIKELTASGYLDIGHGVKLDTVRAQDGASASFMADIDDMLKQSGAPDKIRDEAFQLYLRALPDLSIRKNFIHRAGTPGYSQDAIRALAGHIFHGSFQIARLRYSHELEALRTEAEDMARDMGKAGEDDANAAANIVNELKKRHEWVLNPQDNALTNKISSLGFVYYLGLTPAAALVNLLQTPMVALPILAANHKLADASRELWRAMKQSMSTYGHMQKLLTGDELEAHAEFARRGVFDKTQSHNVAGISESDTHAYNPRWHKVMTIISHVFHKAEVINRESTAMAAYRLARASGAGHIEAVETADRQVHESHFDYSNANRARYMQSAPAKVLLMFRQYSLAVTWLLGRNLYQAIKGEDAQTRTEAKRKLAGVLGMTAIFSGTLGLPILGTVGAVLNAVAAAMGDDDEPWDWETELRAFLRDMLGDQGAEAVLRGPVQALTGVGIASRVSMGDLWFREPDRELEGRAWSNYLFEQAAGPMGGLLTNFFRGQQLMSEGHVWRGVETMMPKAIKDMMKSLRYLDEGVNNLRGDAIVEDLNVFESLAQIAGFAPASVANAYDTARDVKNYEQAILNRRSSLMDAFALAWRLGDVDAREEVLQKMRAFSRTYPELAITSESIRRSLESRARYSAQAENGVIVDKRIRARLEGRLGM